MSMWFMPRLYIPSNGSKITGQLVACVALGLRILVLKQVNDYMEENGHHDT